MNRGVKMIAPEKKKKPKSSTNLKIKIYRMLERIGLKSVKPNPKKIDKVIEKRELNKRDLLISVDKTLKNSESLSIINIAVFLFLSFELVFLAMIESLGYSKNGLTILSITISGGYLELISFLVCGIIAYFTYSYLKDYYATR
jgi:hypothetical protein